MSLFRFTQWIHEGRPVVIYGDGGQSRIFTYVDDIARGTVAAMRPLGSEVINLGSDHPGGLMDVVRLVEERVGRVAELEYQPRHPADAMATWANFKKAGRRLGWRPQVDLADGVSRLVDWYRRERKWGRYVETEH